MQRRVRERVPTLTVLLTVVSLALVFGAALRVIPAGTLPHAPDAVVEAIPHVNAVISVAAVTAILGGIRAIRAGNVARHRRRMLLAFTLFVGFLALYLYRVALEGPTHFDGPDSVRSTLYYPLLAVHVTLAVVCLPLLYYVLLLAYSYPVATLPETNHPRIGRVATVLWLVSFVLGVVVYLLLYVLY